MSVRDDKIHRLGEMIGGSASAGDRVRDEFERDQARQADARPNSERLANAIGNAIFRMGEAAGCALASEELNAEAVRLFVEEIRVLAGHLSEQHRRLRLAPGSFYEPIETVEHRRMDLASMRCRWDENVHAHLCPDCFAPLPKTRRLGPIGVAGDACDECGWTRRADGKRCKSDRTTAEVLDERTRRLIALERAEGKGAPRG